MRNLVIRLVLWLSKRFDIVLMDETRRNAGGDAIVRANRWKEFALEEGGLFDMIEAQRREAFEAYADTPPDQVATKEHLAMQDRALRQVKARVQSIIAGGQIAAAKNQQNAVNVSPFRAA